MPYFSRRRRGFTLIELMIVVAVIGTLAAIAVPKFSDLLRKSKEGSTKGNLGRIRSALSIYYADNEGHYPICEWGSNTTMLHNTLVPQYINKIPLAHAANFHIVGGNVFCHQNNDFNHEGTGFGYNGNYKRFYCDDGSMTKCPGTCGDAGVGRCSGRGDIWVFCRHTDTKGTRWDNY